MLEAKQIRKILLLATLMVVFHGRSYPFSLPQPLALYHFDGDLQDSSGNAQSFDLILGSVTFIPGKFGQAVQFSGGGLIKNVFQGLPPGPWTVAMWLKLLPGGRHPFGFFDNSGAWFALVDEERTLGLLVIGSLLRPPTDPPNSRTFFSDMQIPSDDQFHHITYRYNPPILTITLDGQQSFSIRIPFDYFSTLCPGGCPLRFGVFPNFGENAVVDELVILSGVLTDPEINQLQIGPYRFGIVTVAIDIKPGSFPNSINRKSKATIPVAILSSATFDAPASVDSASLTFGRTGDEKSLAFCNVSPEDVNNDQLPDSVCHFDTQMTAFQEGDTVGILRGTMVDATPIEGSDSVRILK